MMQGNDVFGSIRRGQGNYAGHAHSHLVEGDVSVDGDCLRLQSLNSNV